MNFSLRVVYATLLTGVLGLMPAPAAAQASPQVKLRVFAGGANQRPDLMRQLFAEYVKTRPDVVIETESGGATSDLQRQYLSTILNARDPSIDVYLIDIVNPAQYFGAGWLEPLNAYLGEPAQVMKAFLPAYAASNVVDGQIAAMPAFADAMFMYYRRDLLDKHGIALPRTWDELAAAAKKVRAAEGDPTLQGLSIQGAPIEGAVCTFLMPYWSQGKDLSDAAGRLALDRGAAARGLRQWLSLVDAGVIKRNVAEVKTPDTVNEFKAGQVLFGIGWGFAWDRFASDADSRVRGKVGVMPVPAMAGGRSVTCIGGWQWAVSAFSRHKAEAARLVQFMASARASKFLAVQGSLLPTTLDVYTDPDVLKAVPWFQDAAAVVAGGKSRPASRDYGQVSDAIRTTTSAVLARSKTPEQGVAQIGSRLARVMR
ncbi:MAG: sugar ABC transporter substrate-binding protein [Leptothrix sp. (in: Bacteria)]|nr:sugar ABC transporter substrate-binding protein [Leptothrix sp. (in: b-proteobacteria)]